MAFGEKVFSPKQHSRTCAIWLKLQLRIGTHAFFMGRRRRGRRWQPMRRTHYLEKAQVQMQDGMHGNGDIIRVYQKQTNMGLQGGPEYLTQPTLLTR